MEIELMSLPGQKKNELVQRVKNYKNDLENLNRQINKAEEKMNAAKGTSLFEKDTVKLTLDQYDHYIFFFIRTKKKDF